MAERKIPPTDGLEVFLNQGGSISLLQNEWVTGDQHTIVIELQDVETVRQWLAELLAEAQEAV